MAIWFKRKINRFLSQMVFANGIEYSIKTIIHEMGHVFDFQGDMASDTRWSNIWADFLTVPVVVMLALQDAWDQG